MFRKGRAAKQNPNAAGKTTGRYGGGVDAGSDRSGDRLRHRRRGGSFGQPVIDVRLERPRAERRAATSYPRNPWTGIHAGRELLYDLRHPILFGRRVIAGLRGQIPQVGRQQRILGVGLMTVGGMNVLVGVAMVVRGAGWI